MFLYREWASNSACASLQRLASMVITSHRGTKCDFHRASILWWNVYFLRIVFIWNTKMYTCINRVLPEPSIKRDSNPSAQSVEPKWNTYLIRQHSERWLLISYRSFALWIQMGANQKGCSFRVHTRRQHSDSRFDAMECERIVLQYLYHMMEWTTSERWNKRIVFLLNSILCHI